MKHPTDCLSVGYFFEENFNLCFFYCNYAVACGQGSFVKEMFGLNGTKLVK